MQYTIVTDLLTVVFIDGDGVAEPGHEVAEPGQGEAVLGVGVAGRHQGQGEALEAGAGGREVEVEQVGQQSYHTHLQSSNTLFIIQIIKNIVIKSTL